MDQAAVLRKLPGEKRLMQALQLSDFVRELAAKGQQSDIRELKKKKTIRQQSFSHSIA